MLRGEDITTEEIKWQLIKTYFRLIGLGRDCINSEGEKSNCQKCTALKNTHLKVQRESDFSKKVNNVLYFNWVDQLQAGTLLSQEIYFEICR